MVMSTGRQAKFMKNVHSIFVSFHHYFSGAECRPETLSLQEVARGPRRWET